MNVKGPFTNYVSTLGWLVGPGKSNRHVIFYKTVRNWT